MWDVLFFCGGIVTILSAIILLLVLLVYRKLPFVLQVISIYCLLVSAIEICSYTITYGENGNNLFLLHLHSFVEFIVLTKVFSLLFRQKGKKFYFIPILIVGVLIILINTIFFQSLEGYNSYTFSLVGIYVIICIFLYFKDTLDEWDVSFHDRILKWILTAILIFHAISIIVILFGNIMLNISTENKLIIWSLRAIVIVVVKLIILFQYGKLLKKVYK